MDASAKASVDKVLKDPNCLKSMKNCCRNTVILHGSLNQMMVCSECKTVIKYFLSKKEFQNYESFCRSKNRKYSTHHEGELSFLVFNDYKS